MPPSRTSARRSSAMSSAISPTHDSMIAISISCCPVERSAPLTPIGSSGSTTRSAPVTTLVGATSSKIAASRWLAPSEASSSRAVSSCAFIARSPLRAPEGTVAGLAPRKVGVLTVTAPSTTVKCSERWCPSQRHPHVPVVDGVPNTDTQ